MPGRRSHTIRIMAGVVVEVDGETVGTDDDIPQFAPAYFQQLRYTCWACLRDYVRRYSVYVRLSRDTTHYPEQALTCHSCGKVFDGKKQILMRLTNWWGYYMLTGI